jgi:hypothetical protein
VEQDRETGRWRGVLERSRILGFRLVTVLLQCCNYQTPMDKKIAVFT